MKKTHDALYAALMRAREIPGAPVYVVNLRGEYVVVADLSEIHNRYLRREVITIVVSPRRTRSAYKRG